MYHHMLCSWVTSKSQRFEDFKLSDYVYFMPVV